MTDFGVCDDCQHKETAARMQAALADSILGLIAIVSKEFGCSHEETLKVNVHAKDRIALLAESMVCPKESIDLNRLYEIRRQHKEGA